MDSVEAAAVASAKYKELTGYDLTSVYYRLEGSYVPINKGKPGWIIGCYDSTTKVIADIHVDQETGQIVYTWMPPLT